MSVEFSWLLGAQAVRHQRALRRYILARPTEETKKKQERLDYIKVQKQKCCNKKEERERGKNKTKRTRSKLITMNMNRSCSAAQAICRVCVRVCVAH